MNRVSHFYRLEHISNIPILHAAKDISRGIIMSDAIAQASPIPAVGLIGMECSEKIEDGQKYYDVKIVATLDSYPSIPYLSCFVLTATDGSRVVIGDGSRPMPKPLITEKRGQKASEPTLYQLTITISSTTPPLRVV